jgi:peptide chain release factor subunit 1
MVVYGVQDTMKMIETGAVGKIVCYEDLNFIRLRLRNPEDDKVISAYVRPEQLTNPELYKDKDTGAALEKVEEDENEPTSLPEWLSIHYKDFGCEIEFVTDKSPEGTQFLKGFSGLGGFLRYKVDLDHFVNEFAEEDEEDDDFI